MGQAVGCRLLEAGYPLTVHNRSLQNAAALLSRGAAWADTPGHLVAESEVVLSVLTDDRAVDAVYGGADGLLRAADAPGRPFVEMSTVRTSTALRIHDACGARGATFIDAPLSGPPDAAAAGRLLILAGGGTEQLERARPVLEAFSRRIVHMGPAGAGTSTKLILTCRWRSSSPGCPRR